MTQQKIQKFSEHISIALQAAGLGSLSLLSRVRRQTPLVLLWQICCDWVV